MTKHKALCRSRREIAVLIEFQQLRRRRSIGRPVGAVRSCEHENMALGIYRDAWHLAEIHALRKVQDNPERNRRQSPARHFAREMVLSTARDKRSEISSQIPPYGAAFRFIARTLSRRRRFHDVRRIDVNFPHQLLNFGARLLPHFEGGLFHLPGELGDLHSRIEDIAQRGRPLEAPGRGVPRWHSS